MSELIPTSKKDQNDLLYGTLQDLYKSIIDYEFKHGMVLVAIAGWLITAKHAQELLVSSSTLRLTATLVMLFITALHATWAIRIYLRSKTVFESLLELSYMPQEHYSGARITPFLAGSFCVFHGVVTVALIVTVWVLPTVISSGVTGR